MKNPRLNLLKNVLPKNIDLKEIEEITFILAVEYNDEIYEALNLAILKSDLENFSKNRTFDTQKDALELYLFKKRDESYFICALFSPYELFDNEYVIDILDYTSDIDKDSFENMEVIFKK